MVLMPPGSAKSTYASVLFPSWWFAQHPRSSIIAASHSAGLAQHFSRRTKTLIEAQQGYLGFAVARGANAAASWKTTNGGEYVALGVRGAIAGRRADLVIIDDPVKSQADAESPRQREHVWEWYKADIVPRLKPHGKVLLIMTRWHPEDLGGKLLEQTAESWRVLRLPALAEADDPLGRRLGEALWPEWEGEAELLRKRMLVGPRAWASLYQQTPVPATGRIFVVERMAIVDSLDTTIPAPTIRAWDLAATIEESGNDPDWTVGLKLRRCADGRFIVQDVVRMRGSPSEIEQLIRRTAQSDGRTVSISLPEDPGQAGKSQIAYLTRQLAGFHVRSSRETGPKQSRAMPVASQIETGNVSLLRGAWNAAFLEEMRTFPWGPKDDQVDALSRAFAALIDQGQITQALPFNLFTR